MKNLLLIALCLMLLSACTAAHARQEEPLTLFSVNVGKADCHLLQYGGLTYLIDTGSETSWGQVSAALKAMEIDRLDGVILTHTHHDHTGGAWALATSSIQVDAWYAPTYFTGVKEAKHPAILAAQLRGQDVRWLAAGDTLPFGDGSLTVLAPSAMSDTENCNSLVLLAQTAGGSVLLTGDMEFPEEAELLNAALVPACTVLKVANHGESDATSEALAYTVRPQLAVISTNTEEEPDTPANRVIKALLRAGAQIAQTQQTQSGLRVTIADGQAQAESVAFTLPEKAKGVSITHKSAEQQTITLGNTGAASADLGGWYLTSERGNEIFVLPAGTTLAPGETLVISNLSSTMQGDIVWPDTKVLHKSKSDAIALYDVYGREVSRME